MKLTKIIIEVEYPDSFSIEKLRELIIGVLDNSEHISYAVYQED